MDNYPTVVSRKNITPKNSDTNFVYQDVTYSDGSKQTVYTKRFITDQLRNSDGKIKTLIQCYKYEGKNPIKDSHGSGLVIT